MPHIATNDKGDVLLLNEQTNAWEPAHTASNDAGDTVYFDGQGWQPVPKDTAQPASPPAGAGGGTASGTRPPAEPAAGFDPLSQPRAAPQNAPSFDYAEPFRMAGRDIMGAAEHGLGTMVHGGQHVGQGVMHGDMAALGTGMLEMPAGAYEYLTSPFAPLAAQPTEAMRNTLGKGVENVTGSPFAGQLTADTVTGLAATTLFGGPAKPGEYGGPVKLGDVRARGQIGPDTMRDVTPPAGPRAPTGEPQLPAPSPMATPPMEGEVQGPGSVEAMRQRMLNREIIAQGPRTTQMDSGGYGAHRTSAADNVRGGYGGMSAVQEGANTLTPEQAAELDRVLAQARAPAAPQPSAPAPPSPPPPGGTPPIAPVAVPPPAPPQSLPPGAPPVIPPFAPVPPVPGQGLGPSTTAPSASSFVERGTQDRRGLKPAVLGLDGKIYTGTTHVNAVENEASQTGKRFESLIQNGLINDGYVTPDGKFLTRKQALSWAPPGGAGGPPQQPPTAPPPPPGAQPPGQQPPAQRPPRAPGYFTPERQGTLPEKLFNPSNINKYSRAAEDAARQGTGAERRFLAQQDYRMDPHYGLAPLLNTPEGLRFMDYIQGRTLHQTLGVPLFDPRLQPLADAIRDANQAIATKMQTLPSTDRTKIQQDFMSQQWKPPTGQVQGGRGREGSSGFLRKKTIPDYRTGIMQGREPVSWHPIELQMRYLENASRFLTINEMFDNGRRSRTIRYFTPGKAPPDWAPLTGRLAEKTSVVGNRSITRVAHAPAAWARVYNNFVGRGFQGDTGQFIDGINKITNAENSVKLSMSGYHFLNMMHESMVNEMANLTGSTRAALGKAVTGDFAGAGRMVKTGGKAAARYFAAPIEPALSAAFPKTFGNTLKGAKVLKEYLTPNSTDAKTNEIVELLTAAGGRATGLEHVYMNNARGSFVKAIRHGTLKTELANDWRDAKGLSGPPKFIIKQLGRTLETISYPLFNKYVPMAKNSAFFSTMDRWLQANPTAPRDVRLAAARRIWDTIDNRFGEVVQDNIFWKQEMKQLARISMLSYSWNLGTGREIGGGIYDAARMTDRALRAGYKEGVKKTLRGETKEPVWTPRMDYIMALAVTTATVNAILQYLYTGEYPRDVDDMVAPRTGGTSSIAGKRGGLRQVPERIRPFGYIKDVLGWWEDPEEEAWNKVNPFWHTIAQSITGQDWRGDPLIFQQPHPDNQNTRTVGSFFMNVAEGFEPIAFGQMRQIEPGSHLGWPARLLGLSPAGMKYTDSKGYQAWQTKKQKDAERRAIRHDRIEQQKYRDPSN